MIAFTTCFFFTNIMLLVLIEARTWNRSVLRRHKLREHSSGAELVPSEHPCMKGYPCRNRGLCIPIKDDSDQYTSDYFCECYKQYYTVDPNDNKVCKQNIYHCKEANIKCQNDGKCLDTWGNFYCKCQPGWGGRFCETPFKEDRVNLPMVLFDPDAFTGHTHHFIAVLRYPLTGFNLSYSYGTKEGRLNPTNVEWRSEPISKYMDLLDEITVRIMLKSVGKTAARFVLFDHVFSGKNEFETVYFSLYNGNEVMQFEGEYKVRVNAYASECVPSPFIQDCGSPDDIPKFRRRDLRIFRGRAVKDCPEFKTTLDLSWTIYDVTQRNLPFDDGPWKNTHRHDTIQEEPQEYIIQQFSLPYGKFGLRLRVDERVAGVKRRRSHFNTAVCYFIITPESLLAIIHGGNVRNVGDQSDLIFDASESDDPNEGKSKKRYPTYKWSCENKEGPGLSICKGLDHVFSTEAVHVVPMSELKAVSTLTVQLVYGRQDKLLPAATATQQLRIYSGVLPTLVIVPYQNCLDNKRPNPDEIIVFYVDCKRNCKGSAKKGFYTWSLDNPGTFKWGVDTTTAVHDTTVVVLKRRLTPGETYQFNVEGGRGKSKAATSFTFTVNKYPVQGECTISPMSGYERITVFFTNCSGFSDEEPWPLMYEIYQTQFPPAGSDLYTAADVGEMISYDSMPTQTLTFARGYGENGATVISFLVKDVNDLGVSQEITIEVYAMEDLSDEELREMLREAVTGDTPSSLPTLLDSGDLGGAVRSISSLSDILSTAPLQKDEKIELNKQLVRALSKTPTNRMHAINQVASALDKVVMTNPDALDYECAREALDLARSACKHLDDRMMNEFTATEDLAGTVKKILHTTSGVLKVIFAAEKKDREEEAKIETPKGDYELYSELTKEAMHRDRELMKSVNDALEIIRKTGNTMLLRHINGSGQDRYGEKDVTLSVRIDKPQGFVNLHLGSSLGYDSVKISQELADELGNMTLGVQVAVYPQNLFWWKPGGEKVNSHSILVSLRNMDTDELITHLPEPLDIFFQTDTTDVESIQGSFNVPRKQDGSLDLEKNFPIYQFDLQTGQTIIILFERTINTSVKVMITYNERPELEDFESQGETIPTAPPEEEEEEGDYNYDYDYDYERSLYEDESGPILLTTTDIAEADNAWFFVALIPLDVPESPENFKMEYSFKAITSQCQYWDAERSGWEHTGCFVGHMTKIETIHCRCTHLTLFTSSIFAPPTKLSVIDDIPFLLKFVANPAIMVFILILLVVYVLLMLWGAFLDKRDLTKRNLIILGDNAPSQSYAYLVTVYTGFKKSSGTTSTVGLQLKGSAGDSKPHLLMSESIKTLTTGAKDWFVIFTPQSLGDIKQIHLWSNNRGHRPTWFCDMIVVRDIQLKKRWVFLVKRWLSLVKVPNTTECTLSCATNEELKSKKTLFFNNVIINFREAHIWVGLFGRNPRSFYSCCSRAAVLCCDMTCAMLFNIAFFGIPEKPADQLDMGTFAFQGKIILFGILTPVVILPLNFILSTLFRKSIDAKETRVVPVQRKLYLPEPDVYEDVEIDRQWTALQKAAFYALPTEPLCQTHQSLREGLSGPSPSEGLPPPGEGQVFTPWSLPSVVKYVAWALCIGLIVVFTVLVALYGLNFGKIRSYQWMTTVSFMIYFSVLLVEPLKVLVIACIFTFFLKIHPFDMDLLRGRRLNVVDERRLNDEELVVLRTKPEYKPLWPKIIPPLRVRERARVRLHAMFIDLLIFIVYAIMLYWLAQANRNSSAFRSTKNVKDVFVDSRYHGKAIGLVVNNITLFKYLRETFIPSIHEDPWPEPFDTPGIGASWTSDYNCQLLGVARLRQLRVKPNYPCTQNSEITDHLTCDPGYSSGTSDRSDYKIGWRLNVEDEMIFPEKAKRPWRFQDSSKTGSYSLVGEFASYEGGGYVAELGRTQNNSRLVLDFLINSHWFDPLTRVVIIEFTLYNPNVRLFNVVSILIEMSPTSLYHVTPIIQTVTLIYELDISQLNLLFAFMFFVLIICFYMYQQIASIQRLSCKKHFEELWNILDLVLCTLASLSIVIYFVRNVYVSSLLFTLQNAANNVFVSFYKACTIDIFLTYLMAIVVCVTTLRFWRLLRFSDHFKIFEKTLSDAFYPLLGVFFMMFVFLSAFSAFAYLCMGPGTKVFASLGASLLTLLEMAIGFDTKVDFEMLNDTDPVVGPSFYVIFSVVAIIYAVNMFTTTVMEYYAEAKLETLKMKGYTYTLYDYIWDEINYHCKRGPKTTVTWEQRLRGGQDAVEEEVEEEVVRIDMPEASTSRASDEAEAASAEGAQRSASRQRMADGVAQLRRLLLRGRGTAGGEAAPVAGCSHEGGERSAAWGRQEETRVGDLQAKLLLLRGDVTKLVSLTSRHKKRIRTLRMLKKKDR